MAKTAARPKSVRGGAVRQTAPAPESVADGPQDYPTTKYRKVLVSDKHPNGYDARQCESADDEARFDPAIWKDSPDDLKATPAPKKKGKPAPEPEAEGDGEGDTE